MYCAWSVHAILTYRVGMHHIVYTFWTGSLNIIHTGFLHLIYLLLYGQQLPLLSHRHLLAVKKKSNNKEHTLVYLFLRLTCSSRLVNNNKKKTNKQF